MENKAYLVSLSTRLRAIENRHPKIPDIFTVDPNDLSWTDAFTLKEYWELEQLDKQRLTEFYK